MYSQHDEEAHILRIFGDHIGRFLDIGAHDGHYLSNTLALVERGWSGVLVEPNPRTFARLYDRHGDNPKLALVNAAIGLENKLTKFWPATKDDGLSTTEESQRNRREPEGAFGKPYYVAMVHIGDFQDMFPEGFDFVSIDTEGTSVELFYHFNYWYTPPKLMCVEHDGQIEQCLEHAKLFGYKEVTRNSENLLLAR